MDIEEFYEADERRRRSEEIELGTEWHDRDAVRYEVSWVADTGELYVMREPAPRVAEDLFGDEFAGVASRRPPSRWRWWAGSRRASAWRTSSPDGRTPWRSVESLSWLADRLRDRRRSARLPPAS